MTIIKIEKLLSQARELGNSIKAKFHMSHSTTVESISLLSFFSQRESLRSALLPNGDTFYCVHPLDVHLAYRDMFEDSVYFRHGIEILSGDTVFDVGANIGMFSYYVGRTYPTAQVYSFEPVPPIFLALDTNSRTLNLKNVYHFNIGISKVASKSKFTFYRYSSGWSTMYPNHSQEFRTIMERNLFKYDRLPQLVRMTFKVPGLNRLIAKTITEVQLSHQIYECQLETISEMIRRTKVQKINLLKIDVERSEWDVLQGIEPQDWPKICQVVIEVQSDHDSENPKRVYHLLKEKGFRVIEERADFLLRADGHSVNSIFYAKRAK
jgi:FkbM family methyltransferase